MLRGHDREGVRAHRGVCGFIGEPTHGQVKVLANPIAAMSHSGLDRQWEPEYLFTAPREATPSCDSKARPHTS